MPVEIDADALVREVNAQTGAALSVLGVAPHGDTGGAIYVRWPDGHDGVLTPSTASVTDLERTADVLALAQSQGLPVPRYELIVPRARGALLVQERLPGEVMRLNVERLEAMVAVNEQCAGLLADRPDVPAPRLLLRHEKGDGLLGSYSDRSRDLLARVRQFGDAEMSGADLVHPDFNHTNVLFDDNDRITGVIDWDISRGDRHFALVKLRFLLAWEDPNPAVLARLDELLDQLIAPETLLLYWAHWSLRMVDWTIRHFGPKDVDIHLGVADTRLT